MLSHLDSATRLGTFCDIEVVHCDFKIIPSFTTHLFRYLINLTTHSITHTLTQFYDKFLQGTKYSCTVANFARVWPELRIKGWCRRQNTCEISKITILVQHFSIHTRRFLNGTTFWYINSHSPGNNRRCMGAFWLMHVILYMERDSYNAM